MLRKVYLSEPGKIQILAVITETGTKTGMIKGLGECTRKHFLPALPSRNAMGNNNTSKPTNKTNSKSKM